MPILALIVVPPRSPLASSLVVIPLVAMPPRTMPITVGRKLVLVAMPTMRALQTIVPLVTQTGPMTMPRRRALGAFRRRATRASTIGRWSCDWRNGLAGTDWCFFGCCHLRRQLAFGQLTSETLLGRLGIGVGGRDCGNVRV